MNRAKDHNSFLVEAIDISSVFRGILTSWRMVLSFVFLGLFFSTIYIKVTPSIYQSRVTFFSTVSKPVSGFGGYEGLLGLKGAGSIDGKLEEILNSQLAKDMVLVEAIENFPEKYNNFLEARKKNVSKEGEGDPQFLSLGKELSVFLSGSGLYVIKYKHYDPEIIYFVLNTYPDVLETIYKKMSIGIEKNIISVLDGPVVPTFPVYPKKIYVLFFGAIMGFFVSVLGIVFRLFRFL